MSPARCTERAWRNQHGLQQAGCSVTVCERKALAHLVPLLRVCGAGIRYKGDEVSQVAGISDRVLHALVCRPQGGWQRG